MNILLTGASGFIGSYFLTHNSAHTISPFSFQNDDINRFDFSNIDAVVHLAALVHQIHKTTPATHEQINTIRTLVLAKKAKDAGVKQFIFMSTVKVYGEESDTVYTETTPCDPQDDYGKSKLIAEQELQKLTDNNFTVSVIRTPIVYGSGVKANIKNLITLIQKMPLLPLKNTKNIRSMVYIGNLYALINQILEHRAEGIFLAADDTALSTSDFIRKIANALEKKLILLTIPFFEDSLKQFKPSIHQRLFGNLVVDNTQTKKRLKFQNPYTVDEGIKNMIHGEMR